MSKPKVQQVQQLPFQGNTANTYGYESMDPNNPYVKAYMDAPISVDPGVGRRTDLAEQSMQNRWNSAFTGGMPQLLKMQNMEAESRAIKGQGAAEGQQAQYAQQMADLARKERMLPQLVQTGGTTSGYNSQQAQSGGFLNSLIGGGATVAAAF